MKKNYGKTIDVTPVVQWIKDNAVDGIAPNRTTYDQVHGDLPAFTVLQRRGWNWAKLVEMAGLQPAYKGRPTQNRLDDNALGEMVERRRRQAEPPIPKSWPLFGIPTRTETFVVRIAADTAIRCTRQYFSLR